MASGYSLKDQLFNVDRVRYLAGLFALADAGFDADGFEARVMARLPDLELKQRIAWIADCLGAHLPRSLVEAAPVLRAALPPPLDPSLRDNDFGSFIFAPLGDYVVTAGLEDHRDLSLDLIEEVTQRFSMEWAIRPFLNRWPEEVLARMRDWAVHPHYHVRRLVSEGTRPRLPWGMAVGLGLSEPLPLLDVLRGDPTRYVTRSVANHLNDITKKDPDLVMDRLQAWHAEGPQNRGELEWLTGHALRGLVKAGHPRAMKMLGYDPDAFMNVAVRIGPGPVRIGEALEFTSSVLVRSDTPVLIDYVIHFCRPGGKVSPKVFKLNQAVARQDPALVVKKTHKLRGDATTFRLVPGPHLLEIQVNGQVRARAEFELLAQGGAVD